MLTTKDCVTIAPSKDKKGAEPKIINYDRIYFEFGPNDATEPLTKKQGDGKLKNADGSDWVGTVPVSEPTKSKPYDLLQDSLSFLQAKVERKESESDDDFKNRAESEALIGLLAGFSRGYDSNVRNNIQAKNRPVELINYQAQFEKFERLFKQSGYTDEEATEAANAAVEANKAKAAKALASQAA